MENSSPKIVFLENNGSGDSKVSQNNIMLNIFTNCIMTLNYPTAKTIDAQNNWWGTSKDSVIQSAIVDFLDNGSIGYIDYSPYLSIPNTTIPISPPHDVKGVIEGTTLGLSWSPNPEGDIAGYKIYYKNFTGYSFDSVVTVGNVNNYVLSSGFGIDTVAITAYDSSADGANDQVEGHESWFSYASISGTTSILHDYIQTNRRQRMTLDRSTLWSLAKSGNIQIDIYDLFGRKLKSIANSIEFISEYKCKSKSLPIGNYIVKIQFDSEPRIIPVLSVK